MRIVQLRAENYKRLGVVEINPDGNLVVIGGKNGHGKSSVLDAIWAALKGRAVAPPKPVREGEEKATIQLDLGDLVITRRFTAKDDGTFTDGIKVENADGLRYQRPQEVLDALLGEVGFDPFEFVNLKPKEQVARLLEMVPLTIDLEEFAAADASDYAKRTEVNRDIARLKAQLAGIPVEQVPDDAPDRERIADELANAAGTNAARDSERRRRQYEEGRAAHMIEQAEEQRREAAELRRRADALDAKASEAEAGAKAIREELAALDPVEPDVDTEELRAKLREAETVIEAIRRQAQRQAIADQLAEAEARSEALTKALEERRRERNEALAAAEMPVPGLAFAIDDKGEPVLTFDGLPFDPDQISSASMLRVSTAIGMAANPRLRVLRVSDGSLLDEDSMKMLADMAKAEDFQLWIEVVGEPEGVGIVMENGEVRAPGNQDDSKPAKKAKPKAGDGA